MDELYLTYPEMRLGAGYGETFQTPSRFLREIPEALLEPWDVTSKPIMPTANRIDQADPF
jgi:DNA helicase-2/ATP-dependent DNA helicase PcrA